jgi:hypothetical protein
MGAEGIEPAEDSHQSADALRLFPNVGSGQPAPLCIYPQPGDPVATPRRSTRISGTVAQRPPGRQPAVSYDPVWWPSLRRAIESLAVF